MQYLTKELQLLKKELVEMGAHVESCVQKTWEALQKRDMVLLESIVADDEITNGMEKSIENRCLKLLVMHNPRAGDFRLICAVLKIITDLERIGDHTQDIAEIQMMIPSEAKSWEMPLLEEMYERIRFMLKRGMDAFVAEDAQIAREVPALDDRVDELFRLGREKLIRIIREQKEDPEFAMDVMQIMKYAERIGDHAENISEWVVYACEGSHPRTPEEPGHDLLR